MSESDQQRLGASGLHSKRLLEAPAILPVWVVLCLIWYLLLKL